MVNSQTLGNYTKHISILYFENEKTETKKVDATLSSRVRELYSVGAFISTSYITKQIKTVESIPMISCRNYKTFGRRLLGSIGHMIIGSKNQDT